MDDADKSLVSQNGGFVLIYRHFHLPFKQGVRSSNLRWVTKRNTTTNVVVFFYSLSLARSQYHSTLLSFGGCSDLARRFSSRRTCGAENGEALWCSRIVPSSMLIFMNPFTSSPSG